MLSNRARFLSLSQVGRRRSFRGRRRTHPSFPRRRESRGGVVETPTLPRLTYQTDTAPIPKSPLDNHPPNALLFFSEKELMTTATQQLPSNPAIDFANAVLAETDNAREIINLLHDIAQGRRENSTANDRIAASKTLLDRGLGKCPRHISPSAGTDPESAESDNHVNHSSDTSRSEPDSPRLVTRLDHALNDSIGPAPSAHSTATQPVGASLKPARPTDSAQTPDPFDPLSIHFSIQQHILDITNNCRTLMTALTDICRTPDDNPRVTDYHRVRAGRMLLDRILGTDPNTLRNAVCPDCRQSWTTHTCSPVHPEQQPCPAPARTEQRSTRTEELRCLPRTSG